MYPAGELLMEHGKILNDNSSNAGRHTMEPGETIMKTACWNEAAPSLLSIVCLATLCTAAGYFEARSHNLETSHRHPLVCCALLRRWVSSLAPGNWFSLGYAELSGYRRGKIFRGGENILSRKYLDENDNNVSGAMLCHNLDNDKWWLEQR